VREHVVKADKLKKEYFSAYQKIIALKEIDIKIKKGEFVTIMGPSGAGKTTFLNLIGCLDRPTSGQLDILGCDPTKFNEEKLSHIRLDKIGFVFPNELSGGELQRVAVARALANHPEVLLADEPTGNLDTKNAQELFSLFRKLNKEEGLTIVVATHNVKLGYSADRVILLNDGKIEKDERLVKEDGR